MNSIVIVVLAECVCLCEEFCVTHILRRLSNAQWPEKVDLISFRGKDSDAMGRDRSPLWPKMILFTAAC